MKKCSFFKKCRHILFPGDSLLQDILLLFKKRKIYVKPPHFASYYFFHPPFYKTFLPLSLNAHVKNRQKEKRKKIVTFLRETERLTFVVLSHERGKQLVLFAVQDRDREWAAAQKLFFAGTKKCPVHFSFLYPLQPLLLLLYHLGTAVAVPKGPSPLSFFHIATSPYHCVRPPPTAVTCGEGIGPSTSADCIIIPLLGWWKGERGKGGRERERGVAALRSLQLPKKCLEAATSIGGQIIKIFHCFPGNYLNCCRFRCPRLLLRYYLRSHFRLPDNSRRHPEQRKKHH